MPESLQLDESTKSLLREKALKSFYFFAKGVLGFELLCTEIHKPICDMMQDEANNRQRIVLPRSWLKSTVGSVAYPIWRSVKNPNIRILIVQNSATNAKKKLAVIRGKWESCPMLRVLFPELIPTKDCVWTAEAACLPRTIQSAESTYECAGTRTKLTSRHYDIIIEDDTVAPDLDDMTSETLLPSKDDVEQAIGFHRNCLPLLVDVKKGQIIIIGTRWFERDLISWNMDNEKHYKGVIRAVRETNGLADDEGEITYPQRFDAGVLSEIRNAMGDYLYFCLYMNRPVASKGMVFQPEWFQYYDSPPRDVVCYTTIDLAGDPETAKGDPDYNVVLTTAKDLNTGMIYVLDYFREKCSPSTIIQEIFSHVRRFHPIRVGLESIAYQRSLIGFIKERMRDENLYFMVEAITHGNRSKSVRINGLEPFVKSGLLRFKPHQRELISELCSISRDRGILSAHDDVADALSMQLPMWAITRSKKEEKQAENKNDPMLFDNAEEEITSRKPNYLNQHAWSSLNNN